MKHRSKRRQPQVQFVSNAAPTRRLSKRARVKLAKHGKGFATQQADPSRTLPERRAMIAKLQGQFAALKDRIIKQVGEQDMLGLSVTANCQPGQLRGADGRCGPGIVPEVASGHRLGIDREDMPQIPADKIPQFIRWCRQQGVGVSEEQASVHEMQPVQQDFRQERVDAIPDDAMKQPIIVCKELTANNNPEGCNQWTGPGCVVGASVEPTWSDVMKDLNSDSPKGVAALYGVNPPTSLAEAKKVATGLRKAVKDSFKDTKDHCMDATSALKNIFPDAEVWTGVIPGNHATGGWHYIGKVKDWFIDVTADQFGGKRVNVFTQKDRDEGKQPDYGNFQPGVIHNQPTGAKGNAVKAVKFMLGLET